MEHNRRRMLNWDIKEIFDLSFSVCSGSRQSLRHSRLREFDSIFPPSFVPNRLDSKANEYCNRTAETTSRAALPRKMAQ